ncbi:MAG: translation initiation factor IF-2 [bacterium]|nr:translation initiation factor IF-2 [bacterium]
MTNVRIYEISKKLGLSNREILDICERLGVPAKSHSSALSEEDVKKVSDFLDKESAGKDAKSREFIEEEKGRKRVVRLRKTGEEEETPDEAEGETAEGISEETEEPVSEEEEEVSADDTGEAESESEDDDIEKLVVTEEEPVETVKLTKPKRTAKILGQIDLQDKVEKSKEGEPAKAEAKTDKSDDEKKKKKKRRRSRRKRRGTFEEEAVGTSTTRRKRRTSRKRGKGRKKSQPSTLPPKEKVFVPKKVNVPGRITLGELALGADKTVDEVIDLISELGTDNAVPGTLLGDDEAVVLLETLQCEPVVQERVADIRSRPPVVAVLGHVDHGKTTLLDAIRDTDVVATESGGITQHIGASVVNRKGQDIVFLDTPGHEVFTAMRARGAEITDILVLVVAADDGVMPQTVESINHAKASELPIIVAITKTDIAGTDSTKVKSGLANYGVLTEDWGGDVQAVEVAAPKGVGIEELLEAILLQAEMLELTADYKSRPYGVVVESRLDRGRGPVITVLVEEGVIERGDVFLVNKFVGKIRAMSDDKGNQIKSVGPSMPAEILGCEDVPESGDSFVIIPNQKTAKQIVQEIQGFARTEGTEEEEVFSLDEWFDQIKEGEKNELGLVIKGDVAGSVEALRDSVTGMGNEEVGTKVLHTATGNVSESDVLLASSSKAIVIAFRVNVDNKAKGLARREGVEIRKYDVIYETLADINAALEGLLEPEIIVEDIGEVEVRQIFAIPGGRRIAGSFVKTGKVVRGAIAKLIRDGEDIYDGSISSLKRFKDDVNEVGNGMECGIMLSGFTDIKEGDVIIVKEERKIARRLTPDKK